MIVIESTVKGTTKPPQILINHIEATIFKTYKYINLFMLQIKKMACYFLFGRFSGTVLDIVPIYQSRQKAIVYFNMLKKIEAALALWPLRMGSKSIPNKLC